MKVSVIGAGAIGSMFGGLIKHHSPDTDVVLIARGEHLRSMEQQNGVRLVGPWGDVIAPVDVSEDPNQIANSDLVLLTVKRYSTADAMEAAMPAIGQATVVSIQNGVNRATLQQFVPPERLVVAMTATSIAVTQPGTVDLRRNGISVVGPSADATQSTTVQSVADALSLSQLTIQVDPNIVGAQYNKLIFNTLGVASSLSDVPLIPDAISDSRWRNHVALPLQAEALRVLESAGIPLSNVPDGANVWKFRRLLRLLNVPGLGSLVRYVIARMFREQPIRFSIGEDLRRGKPTEVDFINGELVRVAKEAGTSAPRNQQVMQLVDQMASRDQPFTLTEVIEHFERLS